MFGKRMFDEMNYRLVGVYKYGVVHCGSYVKTEDDESITSLETGEKFYSTQEFVNSILGLAAQNELYELISYDEETKSWVPLFALIDDTEYDSE